MVCRIILEIEIIYLNESTIIIISDGVSMINAYLIPIAIPGLLAFMVEKSQTNLDAKKITKIKMLLFVILTRFMSFAVQIYSMKIDNVDSYFQVFVTIWYFLYFFLLNSALIVINLICNSFINELQEVRNVLQIDTLKEKYIELVDKYRRMKTGLSPFLFVIISFSTVHILSFTFAICTIIQQEVNISTFVLISSVFYYSFLIFYLICFSEESFMALSANNNMLR